MSTVRAPAFSSLIKEAAKPGSASGKTVAATEVKAALSKWLPDGKKPTAAQLRSVEKVLVSDSFELSPAASRVLENFITRFQPQPAHPAAPVGSGGVFSIGSGGGGS